VTIEDFSKLRWRTEQEPTRHHEENTGLGIRPSANNVLLKSTDTVLDWPLPQRKIMMPAKVVRHAMEQGLGA
jgi:hypothetical protein